MLTFQSVVDFTVSTRAIVTALYAQLPANGSELVLFDLNRNAKVSPLLRSSFETALDRLRGAAATIRTTIITNASPDTGEVVERVVDAGRRRNGRACSGSYIRARCIRSRTSRSRSR